MEPARQGVHPFCGACTDETIAWPAPDTQSNKGTGTIFYGGDDPCPRCGSVVKGLYFCVLWIPVWPMGRFRIITLSRSLTGARYVGRRIPDGTDNPYGLNKKTAAIIAEAHEATKKIQRSWPKPPPSQLTDHPEVRGKRYRKAEEYWVAGLPDRALPLYEEVLIAHEEVLPVDDTATLQLRQRVAEAYLAVGRPAAGLALLEQTHAHLKRVLGPLHPDTGRALDDIANVRNQLGLSSDVTGALEAELSALARIVGRDHPASLRTAAALGIALQYSLVILALDVLKETLDRAERALGADHPDTGYVRDTLIGACGVAKRRSEPGDVRAAVLAREHVHGPDAPQTLAVMQRPAQLYPSVDGWSWKPFRSPRKGSSMRARLTKDEVWY
jgi:hypothetical protein